MKLQLCCGENRLPDWVNFDSDMDVTKLPLAFGSSTVETVLIEHAIEHFTGPQVLRLLDECHRILVPGGNVRMICPVISSELELSHARDLCLGHGHQQLMTPESMQSFLWMAGFTDICRTTRKQIDGHWKVIGVPKDDLESCRVEGTKP